MRKMEKIWVPLIAAAIAAVGAIVAAWITGKGCEPEVATGGAGGGTTRSASSQSSSSTGPTGAGAPRCDPQEKTYSHQQPLELKNLKHTGGDEDFAGHGPQFDIRISLRVDTLHTSIWAKVWMQAIEKQRDFTKAEGEIEKSIYSAPDGWRIKRILSPMRIDIPKFDDIDHKPQHFDLKEDSPATAIEVMGDTEDNDVDEVWAKVFLRPIRLEIVPRDCPL